ncbi:hypothetical protein ACJZ2D_014214 [Fusarium nematophilum]
MADPFSIASGVAGIVSLGLTLCDGLHTYLDAIKDRDEDIELASQRLAVLRSSIPLIQSSASTLVSRYGPAAQGVILGLELCRRQLRDLDRTVGELRDGGGSRNNWQKIAKYPFSRNKLIQVQDQLLWATATLGTFVQNLILNVNVGVGNDLEAFRSAVKDSSSKTQASLDALVGHLGFIGPLVRDSDSKLAAISTQVREQSVLASSSHSLMQRVNSEVSSQSSQLTAISSDINELRALCQSRLLEQNENEAPPCYARNSEAQRKRNRDFATRSCSCRFKSKLGYHQVHQSRHVPFSGLIVSQQTERKGKHYPGCVFYVVDSVETTKVFSLTYTGLRWLFSREVALSLHSNSRKGASWITYELRAYHIVEKSPVFDLLRHYRRYRSCYHNGRFGNIGNELLHVYDGVLNALRATLRYLQEIGADINASTFDQRTALDMALEDTEWCVFLLVYDTLDEYPQFDPAINGTHEELDFDALKDAWKGSFHERIDIVRALGYGELFAAVIQRDMGALGGILNSDRLLEHLSETDGLGRNALHKCSDWAPGLGLMLRHRATHGLLNGIDDEGFAPVHYALRHSGKVCRSTDAWSCCQDCNCCEALQLMLEADCSVWIHPHTNWQYYVLENSSLRAKTLFLTHLRDRWERLRDMSIAYLPIETLERLRVRERAAPDLRVKSMRDALYDRGVEMDKALELLWYPYEGFEHAGFFAVIDCPKVADLAWSLGFRSAATDDWLAGWFDSGRSMLHYWCAYKRLMYVEWLCQKGARLDNLIFPSLGGTGAHALAQMFGMWIGRRARNSVAFPSHLFSRIWLDPTEMQVPCPCSVGELSRPLGRLLAQEISQWSGPICSMEDRLAMACSLIGFLQEKMDGSDWSFLSRSIVYLLTMQFLGVRHLQGCQVGDLQDMSGGPPPWEEWNEILDEDRLLIGELEELKREFEQELSCGKVPIKEFLWDYWLPRMEQVEQDLDEPLSEGQKESLRQAGVVLGE